MVFSSFCQIHGHVINKYLSLRQQDKICNSYAEIRMICNLYFCLLFALCSKLTAMVMAGRSVYLTTLEQAVNQYFMYILSLEN